MSPPRAIGLGCMRLSTDANRDERRALETLRAALDAGVTLLDTAPSYGHGEGDEHHNERLIARALADFSGDRSKVRITTKAGLVRRGTSWQPDGRQKSLRASCLASLEALGVQRIDCLLLHAPDPKTPIATSVRALAALQRDGLIGAIGVCNVSRAQLEIARQEADIQAVQIALGAFDDAPFRSGLAARAAELGLTVYAHTPLGGPKRSPRLERDAELGEIAARYGVSAGTLVLAWLYALGPIVPLPGARRPQTARQSARAATLVLDGADRDLLDARFSAAARAFGRLRAVPVKRDDLEIVMIMGIQGAGKSVRVRGFVESGYERLNRDERGGTLRGLAQALDERLRAGGTRFVLDNTYLTRALRSHVLDVARAHGARVRCIWLDTPLEAAQRNAVWRLLDRHGRLPEPDELAELAKKDPNTFAPTVQLRARRELEPPERDEGFDEIEVVASPRSGDPGADRAGLALAWDALGAETDRAVHELAQGAPVLVFAFRDEALDPARVSERLGREAELAICGHGGGPPRCWCRPPLPGLIVPWQRRQRVDPARSLLIGASAAHRRMAETLGFAYRDGI